MFWEQYENGQITLAEAPKITCQCLRVPVLNGHTAAVFINFEKKPTKGTAYRETGKLQRISTGSRTSKCSEAVYPVPGRGQPSAGKNGRRLREWNGRIHRASQRRQHVRL